MVRVHFPFLSYPMTLPREYSNLVSEGVRVGHKRHSSVVFETVERSKRWDGLEYEYDHSSDLPLVSDHHTPGQLLPRVAGFSYGFTALPDRVQSRWLSPSASICLICGHITLCLVHAN
jgi:hypothetical protein